MDGGCARCGPARHRVAMIGSGSAGPGMAIKLMDRRRLRSVEVRPVVQQAYNAALHVRLQKAIWTVGGCKIGSVRPVGDRDVTLWPGFTWQFRRKTRRFDPLAYTLKPARKPAGKPRSLGGAERQPLAA